MTSIPQGAKPRISVITVVRNGEKSLEQTIRSVLSQEYDSFEYILVDGASTDGTLDILRAHDRAIRWISEPDRGIYDAMNKGLAMARGHWIYFLGVDDRLAGPRTLSDIAPFLDESLALVFGLVRYPCGRVVKSRLSPRTLLHNTVHHQGAFYHSRLFSGWRYNGDYRIVADYELNLLLYLRGDAYGRIDEAVAICGDMGVSLKEWDKAVAETNALRRQHVGAVANTFFSGLNRLEMALYRMFLFMQRRARP